MALAAGTRIGHYEVVSPLGAGGMGEVYRARDTTLSRDVALKIIPAAFATDPERLARFSREAQTLAALNHPHIAQVFGVEEADGIRALAMELVDGEDLAQRIARGTIVLSDALTIARQIAEALEAAHEKGIVHRDLKPANIMLDRDGRVKVLDFGLAKVGDAATATGSAALNSPTITSPAHTQAGVILGTAAYMSPEQAMGKPADKRSDVWAFGCVLYELLAGTRAFETPDIHTTLASVLAQEPDWSALDPQTPAAIRKLLRRALEKDRKRRLADLGDARLEIEDVLSGHAVLPSAPSATQVVAPRASKLPWVVAIVMSAAAIAALLYSASPPAPQLALTRVNGELGASVALVTAQGPGAILSPDGRSLVFVGQPSGRAALQQLYLRDLAQLSARPLGGTEGAMNPFFSPDARWLGFFAGGKLKKISTSGGAAVTLADAPNGRGGSWGDDDHVIYMPDFYSGLWRVSSTGGTPARVTTTDANGVTHRWPQALPGGRAVLYTSHERLVGYEYANLVVQPLPSGAPKVVQREGFFGRYLPSGHIVYLHEGSIFAAPFDLTRLERTGDPVPVIDDVAGGAIWTGAAQFDVAGNGTTVYVPGHQSAAPIEWVDEAASITPLHAAATNWSNPTFSPDGTRLAVDASDGKQADIYLHDVSGREPPTRLTLAAGDDIKPVWWPDGRRLVFAAFRKGSEGFNLNWQSADGAGTARVIENARNQNAGSWHPGGRYLAVTELHPDNSFDIVINTIEGDEVSGYRVAASLRFAGSRAAETEPMFSPDGKWIAYASNESGRPEIYVRPFPGPGGIWQISTDGGWFATWNPTKPELLFSTLDQRLMVSAYTAEGNVFKKQPPRPWSTVRYQMLGPVITRSYNLHPDGKRVALARAPEPGASNVDKVVFVFNLFDELHRLAPVR